MIVKTADKTFDSTKEPVMIILNDKDKVNINNMTSGATVYGCFPKGTTNEEINKWIQARMEPPAAEPETKA